MIFIWLDEWDGGQLGNTRHYASIVDYSIRNEGDAKKAAEASGLIPPDQTLSQYRWTWQVLCKGQARRPYSGFYLEGFTPDGWYLGVNYPPYNRNDAFLGVAYEYYDDYLGYPVSGGCFQWRI